MATQFAKASFSEVYDMHTEAGNTTFVEIHTPISDLPQRMLNGFFNQFRKFRYTGCDVTMVPVSTLPADPLQISLEAGEPTIDPRDMVNPICFKGISSRSLGILLDQIFANNVPNEGATDPVQDGPITHVGESLSIAESTVMKKIKDMPEALEALYYQILSDSSWKKAGVQSGFRRTGLHPLVYPVQTTSFASPGWNTTPDPNGNGTPWIPAQGQSAVNVANHIHVSSNGAASMIGASTPYAMSGQPVRMGWMPTNVPAMYKNGSAAPAISGTSPNTILPLVPMMMIVLPPAYKTEMYFRISIKHYFEFKDFANSIGADAHSNNTKVVPAWQYVNVVTSGASVATTTTDQPEIVTSGVA